MTRTALIYARVSTPGQADHGVSLGDQIERTTARARAEGMEILDTIVDDGYSAASLDRPGMQLLLRALEEGDANVVVVTKLDRLTRSVRDVSDLLALFEKRGVSLVSLNESIDTSTAVGRLMVNLIATISQWQREAIAEGTKAALDHKRRQGHKLGGKTPYGYTVEVNGATRDGTPIKVLVKHDGEQTVLTRMRELHAEGHSLTYIAAALNAEGLRTRDGGEWTKSGCWTVLRKEK